MTWNIPIDPLLLKDAIRLQVRLMLVEGVESVAIHRCYKGVTFYGLSWACHLTIITARGEKGKEE
jgi:hypothetical protein